MKKTKIFLIPFSAILILGTGVLAGYFFCLFSIHDGRASQSDRQAKMQIRTESFQPSCEDLKAAGGPRVVKQGKDTFVIMVSQDYFHVLGFNAEPGKVPVTAWWGAGLDAAIKQACGNQ